MDDQDKEGETPPWCMVQLVDTYIRYLLFLL